MVGKPPEFPLRGRPPMEIVLSYADKLKDPRWQQMRLRVFERDNWKCRWCGKSEKTLHAHHAVYHPLADGPWDYDERTIVTLCCECHSDLHVNLKASQANVLMALAECGVWDEFELDLACCIISLIDWESSSPDKVVMKGEA